MNIDKELKELEKKFNKDKDQIIEENKKIKIKFKERKKYLDNPQSFVEVVVKLSTVFIFVSISSIGFGIYIFKSYALIGMIWLIFGEIFLYVYLKCLFLFDSNIISKIIKEQLRLLEDKYNKEKEELIKSNELKEKEVIKKETVKTKKNTSKVVKEVKKEIKDNNKNNDNEELKIEKIDSALISSKYTIEYQNENEFRKRESAVKKYNMLAYKKMNFEYYPKLIEGDFLGKIISKSKKDNSKSYELKLPTDDMFSKVHGDMILHYTVYENTKTVLLTNITPDDILSEGHRSELEAYKGVMISKTNADKDKFKIDLLKSLNDK